MTADVLAIGLLTLDIVGHPIDALPAEEAGVLIGGIEVVPAGTAGGFALVAATLGLKTSLISALGRDRMGRFVRLVLEEHGVDTGLVATLEGFPTSATILPVDSKGRRPTLHAAGASMLTQIGEAEIEAAGRARFVHYAAIGAFRIDAAARTRFLQAARGAGATISCDLISPGPAAHAEIAAILPAVDIFMPSLAEARFLTGHTEPEAAAAALRGVGARQCVIKCGADGVLLDGPEGQQRLPAFDVTVMDTTSCGDAFCAGTVAGLARGWALAEACRFGAATAALVAQGLGTLGKLQNFQHTLDSAAKLAPRTHA
jgi:sugar/nucleoside kinase (ribokinase family)